MPKVLPRLALGLLVLSGAAARAEAPTPADAKLTITIHVARPEPSTLKVGIFDAAGYDGGPALVHQEAAAARPDTILVFEHLTPGRVAVKVLQDLNGNGKMDKTLIGVPEEPFGLSNDIEPDMSAPGFDQTGFDLKPGDNAIAITMQEM